MDRQPTALEYFNVPGFDSLVNAGIEKGRKATMRIVVTDRTGNPPDEATIEYRQRMF